MTIKEGETGEISISIPAALEADLIVDWVLQPVGTEPQDPDFDPMEGVVTIAAGTTEATVSLDPIADGLEEGEDERHLAVFTTADDAYKGKALVKVGDGVAVVNVVASALVGGGGDDHTCFIKDAGAYCWGGNGNGELGDSTEDGKNQGVLVTGLAAGVTAIDSGRDFSCAIVAGAVKCWGQGDNGQMGDGGSRNNNFTAVNSLVVQLM